MAKVYELLIDEEDEFSGVDFLSIVKNPATQLSWEIFNEQTPHNCELHDHDFTNAMLEGLIGEDMGIDANLVDFSGCKISPVEFEMNKEGFVSVPPITANPRVFDINSADSEAGYSITRYIYAVDTGLGAPVTPLSRPLCRSMIFANRIFTKSDINNLSNALTSSGDSFKLVYRKKEYTNVDFWQYKAGKFCRHRFVQIEFPIKPGQTFEQAAAKIPLKADQAFRTGGKRIGDDGSRPFQSEYKLDPPKKRNFSSEESLDPIGFHMGLFIYSSRFAALIAEPTTKVITKVKVGDMEGYSCCDIHPEYFEGSAEIMEKISVRETFEKVPDYMREAAKRAVDYAEENGWGDCGTDVGKRRANDLADPSYEPSTDILSRMYSYGSRHKKDWEASKSIDEGCGYLMMLSWSFTPSNYDSAMAWLERQLKDTTEMNVKFSTDEMKYDITAVVFQPNQKIYRWDAETNSPYWVFMSRDTIRKMLMKYSRIKAGKPVINIEHSNQIISLEDAYTYENWLVGDDPLQDKSYKIFGRTFEPGTWLTTIHFKNKELFNEYILSNSTRGVSLEGSFMEVPFNFMKEKEEFVSPNPGESEDDFIGRCMGELVGEFPDMEQRLAVCYSYYKERFDFPDGTCWDGFEPYGTKIVDGREVPNCVPIRASKYWEEEIEAEKTIMSLVDLLKEMDKSKLL